MLLFIETYDNKHEYTSREFSVKILHFLSMNFLGCISVSANFFSFVIHTVYLLFSVDLFIILDFHYTCYFKISFNKHITRQA